MSTKLLSQEQARAIYSVMCELNNIGARLNCQFDGALNYVNVCEDNDGLHIVDRYMVRETYASQYAFAQSYGLE